MADPDLVQALIDAVAASDDDAAETAAQTMTGRAEILPALRPLLADADPDRRWWAVRSLALIGGDEAGRLLEAELTGPDEATRCAAALALGQLGVVPAIPALMARLADESGWVRDSAADALVLIGEPAEAAVVEALGDARQGVRVRAAAALRRILLPLHRRGPDQGLRFAYTHLMAVTALFGALNDPNRLVRHNAYEALDGLGLLETVLVSPG